MSTATPTQIKAADVSPKADSVGSVIASHPFLHGLKPEHLRLLADNAVRINYQEGDLIFREGEAANRFYLIEQGHVSLESQPRDEEPISVQVIGPGDVMGWSWLFPPCRWNFDARALEPTTAILLYGARLRDQCADDHDFGFEMMKRMTQVAIHRLQAGRKKLLALKAGARG